MKKGLCLICTRDKGCTFPRAFPVWQCEEFTVVVPKAAGTKPARRKKVAR